MPTVSAAPKSQNIRLFLNKPAVSTLERGQRAARCGNFLTQRMNSTLSVRLTALVLGMAFSVVLIGWGAHTAVSLFADVSTKLSRVSIESFQTADQFRASLQELDLLLLRFSVGQEAVDQEHFLANWKKHDAWIDAVRPRLSTDRERLLLDRINEAYDDYFNAATNLFALKDPGIAPLATLSPVNNASQRLLDLAYQLAGAHGESLDNLLASSHKSLRAFRALTFGALALLVALCIGASLLAYKELVWPLRVKLVESHQIIARQEKLASLGMLAATIAHEVRNPLTAIKARLFTQKKLLAAGSPASEDADVIGNEINRLEKIVKDFLTFARPSDPLLVEVPADVPLREVHDLLGPQLKTRGIHLALESGSAPRVNMDPAQLKQVVLNLVQNSADSIGENGQILLRGRQEAGTLKGQQQDTAVLEVSDTGRGIPPEVQARLFDPFFTTKERGTGLGLAIAARIVEKHGGILRYQTSLNHGTTFGVVLPLAKS